MNIRLIGIDWQNDFCDPNGALYVKNADKDSENLVKLIERLNNKITGMHFTMDSHQLVHIAHPIWWVNSEGNHPSPFTIISMKDVLEHKWQATKPQLQKRSEEYVQKLDENKRYVLCIWPPHCLIGSKGHNIFPNIYKALLHWEEKFKKVDFRVKGSNPYTEHYSAVQADVPDPDDPMTMLDTGKGSLIQILADADKVLLTGQALSHCLANTVRDIVNNFGEENIKKMYLLEDCASSVSGFEDLGKEFINDMISKGMNILKSTEFSI